MLSKLLLLTKQSGFIALLLVIYKLKDLEFLRTIASSIFLALLRLLRVRSYQFTGSHARHILNNNKHYSEKIKNYRSDGIVIGSGFVGYVEGVADVKDKNTTLSILSFESVFKRKLCNSSTLIITNPNGFANHGYDPREMEIDLSHYEPRTNQQDIVDKIVKLYKEKQNIVAFLHGEPGAGKSTIALIVTKILQGKVMFDFNPTNRDSDDIFTIHELLQPQETSPLIVVIDEVDTLIEKVHYSTEFYLTQMAAMKETYANRNKTSKIARRDDDDEDEDSCILASGMQDMELRGCSWTCKRDYNTDLDKINNGWFKNLILIMTSNRDPEYINALDSSYLRPGRVNFCERIEKLEYKSN